MEVHPLCRILPEMPEAEFRPLVADIRAKGLLRPITTFEGMILDGRHRFKACAEADVTPRFEPYTGTDPVGFVQSCCTHRNLNPTQRAMVAAGFLAYEQEQAKKRQAHGDTAPGKTLRTNLPEASEGGRARDKAGARMGVCGTSVDTAAKVLAKAAPEIVEKCKKGEMALNEAKRVVDLNPQAQRRIAALPKKQRDVEISSAHARSVACKKRDTKPTLAAVAGSLDAATRPVSSSRRSGRTDRNLCSGFRSHRRHGRAGDECHQPGGCSVCRRSHGVPDRGGLQVSSHALVRSEAAASRSPVRVR